jgi:two-component system, OmpR family, copper resistance phosphate regulon response regulator CusR
MGLRTVKARAARRSGSKRGLLVRADHETPVNGPGPCASRKTEAGVIHSPIGARGRHDGDVIRSSFTSHFLARYCLRSRGGSKEQMRILIVEDEARIRAFLARAFEAEGFGVDVVGDGEQGLSRALTGSYDLVILDLMLPGRSGLDALRELHRQRSDLPVLILSARSDLPIKLRSFELGAVDYVPKPFSLDELLARARVQLRRARIADDGTTIRVGTLVLDLARRQARVGDKVADLSDREFRLLHFLMQHVGQVVSRERLLAEVWGYDFDPRSNVVDVCVRRLRRRLGPDAPIETVRNAGYRAAA